MKKRILVKLIDRWHQTGSNNLTLSAVDVVLLFLAVYMGYALRLTIAIPDKYIPEMVISGIAFAGVVQIGFFIARLHRVYWLQASVEEFYRMSWTYVASSIGFVILSFYILPFEVPRTSLAIFICLGFILLCIVRASLRFVYIGDSCKPCRPSEGKAFVVGAGQAGCLLVRDLKRSGSGFKPVAFFDDDPGKIGKSMAGIPVLDSIEKLPSYTREFDVNMVLIALPSLSGGEIQEILKKTDKTGLEVRVLPGLFELAEGSVTVNRLRKVSIEDLLRREPIKLDLEGIGSVITDKTVLITGAGGSIGSEICRQVASHRPKEIIALGHGEFSIYTLLEGLEEDGINVPVYPVIADVADDKKMSKIFEKHKPQVIFHAAAHKHVPLMECNPDEAIRVNCWGTWTIARLAGEHGAERMVMISTDKAANPIN
ncbi:MAG: polysaccharide biosynthesis protein, partial [Synergistales bacterium]|nr:polysaccharide biosynthesis protein [Synergistales bacterium]